jgi:hypothetical protein
MEATIPIYYLPYFIQINYSLFVYHHLHVPSPLLLFVRLSCTHTQQTNPDAASLLVSLPLRTSELFSSLSLFDSLIFTCFFTFSSDSFCCDTHDSLIIPVLRFFTPSPPNSFLLIRQINLDNFSARTLSAPGRQENEGEIQGHAPSSG